VHAAILALFSVARLSLAGLLLQDVSRDSSQVARVVGFLDLRVRRVVVGARRLLMARGGDAVTRELAW